MKKIAFLFALLLACYSLQAQSVMVSANLPGRFVKSGNFSIPDYDFSESGIVVVDIEVNKDGKVVKATAGADGTTLKSALLWTRFSATPLSTQ